MPVAARDTDQVAKRAPRRLDTAFTKRVRIFYDLNHPISMHSYSKIASPVLADAMAYLVFSAAMSLSM